MVARLIWNAVKLVVVSACLIGAALVVLGALHDESAQIWYVAGAAIFMLLLAVTVWKIGAVTRISGRGGLLIGTLLVFGIAWVAYQAFSGRHAPLDCGWRVRKAACHVQNWLYDIGGNALLGVIAVTLSCAGVFMIVNILKQPRKHAQHENRDNGTRRADDTD